MVSCIRRWMSFFFFLIFYGEICEFFELFFFFFFSRRGAGSWVFFWRGVWTGFVVGRREGIVKFYNISQFQIAIF